MEDDSFRTTELHDLVSRIQTGDRRAADDLIRRSATQLENLASRMLVKFPTVRRWEQTGDVLQNALQRLLKTIDKVQPSSVDGYFCLGARAIRWELLEMARRYRKPSGLASTHESIPDGAMGLPPLVRLPEEEGQKNLDRWTAFHEAVDRMPEETRTMIELSFYQGLSKTEISRVLEVDERTVRRRWNRAARHLAKILGDEIPV